MPRAASNRISLTRPVSITAVTSSMVIEVSATLVDTTILATPAGAGGISKGSWLREGLVQAAGLGGVGACSGGRSCQGPQLDTGTSQSSRLASSSWRQSFMARL